MKQLILVFSSALVLASCAPQMAPTTTGTGSSNTPGTGSSASATSNTANTGVTNNDPQNAVKMTGQSSELKDMSPAVAK